MLLVPDGTFSLQNFAMAMLLNSLSADRSRHLWLPSLPQRKDIPLNPVIYNADFLVLAHDDRRTIRKDLE